jgi:hypothetical protein
MSEVGPSEATRFFELLVKFYDFSGITSLKAIDINVIVTTVIA